MKRIVRILYLINPVSNISGEFPINIYDIRKIHFREDISPAFEGFDPQVILWDLNSKILPQDVLQSINSQAETPVIIAVDNNLEPVLPLLKAISIQDFNKEEKLEGKENELQEQDRLRSVYDHSQDAILITKPDGRIISANPSACKLLEMTEEEIGTVGLKGVVDQEDPNFIQALAHREKFGHVHTELTFKRKSGEKFPVELTSSIFRDSQEEELSTIIFRDITHKKQAEDEVRISHEAYRTMFYQSPIPYWLYDEKTLEIIDVNEVALSQFGYTREEFLNLNIKDLRPKEEIPRLLKHLNDPPGGRGIVRLGKFTHLKKDNSLIKAEVYGYKFKYGNRDCRLVASIDITEKEEAVARLELKRARLNAAQELAKVGYWEFNISTQEFFLSEMMCKLWGKESIDIDPSWSFFEESLHPDDWQKFIKAQDLSMRKDGKHILEYRIKHSSGDIKWIQEKGRVLTWEESKPQTVERIVRDVTEEKLFLEKLVTSESRYKGIFQSQTNYLIRTDMQGNYTQYNDKFFADFGWVYENQEIIGSPSLTSIMEYHHQSVIDIVERCVMAPGTAFQIEIDKPDKNGGVRTTLWDFVCLVDSRGNPVEIQCVGIDISARVKAEKQLKDSELRYQLITRATSDVIYDWDIQTGKLYWGKSLLTMTGHDPKDVENVDASIKMLHPDDAPRIGKELTDALVGTETKWQCEYRLKKKNGEYAYVVDAGTFLRDKDDKAYRLVGALEDITEKKRLEDLLEKSNKLSRIGSFELDLVNNKVYWSQMTREIHEVEPDFMPDVISGINFYKAGFSRTRIQEAMENAINKNQKYDEELELLTATGKELWVKVIAQPEMENGRCVRISGSIQDVDKIKRAELELTKAAQEKDMLLESIGDAFFAVDGNWTVTYWNKQAARLLDCPKSEILDQNVWEVFPEALGTPFQYNYQATMEDKKKRRFEAFFARTSSWYDVNVYPSEEGLSVFFKDVTQRKAGEVRLRDLNNSLRAHTQELVSANKDLEQFTYIVSHNLRSPVANIQGLSDLLKNASYPDEIKEKLMAEVFSNVERLDMVIKDLNNILKVKVAFNAKREKIDLNELVNGISSSIQNLLGEEQARIICDFKEKNMLISVRSYVHSIFHNLIINSIKYRRPDVSPVLKITTKAIGEAIVINFEDNGLGMDLSRNKEQLFNLYKRFHHHVEGKGMGLFMVKTQVEMLGGKISVDSQVNKGTNFTIVFLDNNFDTEDK